MLRTRGVQPVACDWIPDRSEKRWITRSFRETMDLRREFRILISSGDPRFDNGSLQVAMFPFQSQQTGVGRRHCGELQPLRLCEEIPTGMDIENEAARAHVIGESLLRV